MWTYCVIRFNLFNLKIDLPKVTQLSYKKSLKKKVKGTMKIF